ncbi:TIM barrel metal-dependent hydrolase, putative [Cordyceps militaris CM01]|uniref:TIM barrel metal-dependent hydrolase, putative n=1 Tax=Cordyceps militaris (strain CM01) TaxID=983644 RepID=G3JB98_CORMM|nr:TIM barrel metal-dependent hydrolase, putative [Cordyceps militaris CM01]EGX95256.1 TIM barrel metal-dependent hydrolase, putative [Cordyceps militaris CM01]
MLSTRAGAHLVLVAPATKTKPHLSKDTCHSSKLSLGSRIPPGAWDSHMHILDPERYPLAKDALYHPNSYTLEQALSFESSVALDNIVLVQPSIYGNDNSCLLDALRVLGPHRARAVVGFEPSTTSFETLREWHALGVRGVRVNLSSVGKRIGSDDLRDLLHSYAQHCRLMGWVIQIYIPMGMMPLLEPIVPDLGVRVCIDHIGHPCLADMSSGDPYDMHGFRSLVNLLKGGSTFVKLSAPYRLGSEANPKNLEAVSKEIIRVAGNSRGVFATDWPHTRFEGLDIRPWMEAVLDWCGDDRGLVERIFRENARELWDT